MELRRIALANALTLIIALSACGMLPAGDGTDDGGGADNGGGGAAADPWRADATEHRGRDGERFEFSCPAGGTPGTVWGTDVYTDDSSVCTAAVHAGKITFESGGTVTIEIRPGEDGYDGSERNGVETLNYGSYEGSFIFPDDE